MLLRNWAPCNSPSSYIILIRATSKIVNANKDVEDTKTSLTILRAHLWPGRTFVRGSSQRNDTIFLALANWNGRCPINSEFTLVGIRTNKVLPLRVWMFYQPVFLNWHHVITGRLCSGKMSSELTKFYVHLI